MDPMPIDQQDLAALVARATEWAVHDPEPDDRAHIRAAIAAAQGGDEAAAAELAAAFSGPLTFGTAGLRGPIGPGESRMNRAVVIRTTAGLVAYLGWAAGERPHVVVGCDARHGSAAFARDVAAVAAAAGCRVSMLPARLPTPVLAFAVRHLDADAGVMITASHNPPADNGYKVYLGGRAASGAARGVQIVPPADAQIADAIRRADAADEVLRVSRGWDDLGDEIVEAYLRRVPAIGVGDAAAAAHGAGESDVARRSLKIVLTPMHGVGGTTAVRALAAAGFDDVTLVAAQANPDPDFPTVAFPNPEEPGSLDLAIDTAREVRADIVFALDPDADRCSVAVPDRTGQWRRLTGDELGALLGDHVASQPGLPHGAALANSVVSGRLLKRIADAHGLRHATTLTGFKWIARVEGLVFGYEEAIGYCCDPEGVRDKDGIGAAVVAARLASDLLARGRSLDDALDELAREHGLHATAPATFRFEDLSLIAAGMERLRATPPTELAGSPVVESRDLKDGLPEIDLPPTDGLLFRTAADDRVIVRPSGTEPKLKGYLEVVLPCGDDGSVPHAAAAARLAELRRDLTATLGL